MQRDRLQRDLVLLRNRRELPVELREYDIHIANLSF